MIFARVVTIASLSAVAAMPAIAADYSHRTEIYVDTRPAVGAWTVRPFPVVDVQPFRLVNQGPVFSGPGIMITEIGYTWTGVRRSYPFIGPPRVRARGRYAVRSKVSHKRLPRNLYPAK